MKFDFYNILLNFDKNDEVDFDFIFNNLQFEYYSVLKLNNLFYIIQGKGIFFFYCNIRSLIKNLILLNDMLYFLDLRLDVMVIIEIRLSFNFVFNFDILNYNFFYIDLFIFVGGVVIYVNKVFKVILRFDLKIDLLLVEFCWVEIDFNNNRKYIMIGCIYKYLIVNVEEFMIKFDEFLN